MKKKQNPNKSRFKPGDIVVLNMAGFHLITKLTRIERLSPSEKKNRISGEYNFRLYGRWIPLLQSKTTPLITSFKIPYDTKSIIEPDYWFDSDITVKLANATMKKLYTKQIEPELIRRLI